MASKGSKNSILDIFQQPFLRRFYYGEIWMFDVTSGSWDGAEVCKLVGLYLLSQLSDLPLEVGLYCDDGLAVTRLKPRQADRAKDFNPITRKCRLCMTKKFNILYKKSGATLNERSELLFST